MGKIEDVCHYIAERRSEMGISQLSLHCQTGLSLTTIKKIESGKGNNMRAETLVRIAKVLGNEVIEKLMPNKPNEKNPREVKFSSLDTAEQDLMLETQARNKAFYENKK